MKQVLFAAIFCGLCIAQQNDTLVVGQTKLAEGALEALHNLQSATSIGINYKEYQTRLVDAKIVVDRYGRQASGSKRDAIVMAMTAYQLAGFVWGVKINTGPQPQNAAAIAKIVETGKGISTCEAMRRLVKSYEDDKLMAHGPNDRQAGIAVKAVLSVNSFFECASEKLAEAEAIRE